MGATRLVCIDFDKTTVNGHFHSTLFNRGTEKNSTENGVQVLQGNGVFKNIKTGKSIPKNKGASREQIEELLKGEFGPKNQNEMADTIRLAIDNGHAVAFTSFTLYPEVIKQTLEFIGLEDSYIKKIAIIGGFPDHGKADRSPDGKEQHIDAALEEFKLRGMPLSRSDVMLVDDSKHNIDIANKYSQTNVLVPAKPDAKPSYFEPIRAFIEKPVSEIASNPDPNLEESENSKFPISQLNALSTAEIKKFRNKEETYLKFPNDKERQEARALLADTFGEDAFRVSSKENYIEVKDKRIIDLLRGCEGEQNKVAMLQQQLVALETVGVSHLQVLLDEPIKDFVEELASEAISNPDPNLEEPENNKFPLSQLNALSTAEIKKFGNKEETYLKFPNDKERQEACVLLADTFGEDAFRISRMKNHIEVKDERIIDLLRGCEGEQNKVAMLQQQLVALDMDRHFQSLINNIQEKYRAYRERESMPQKILKKGTEITFSFSVDPRDKQISALQREISKVNNNRQFTQKEKREEVYLLISKLASDIRKEHNVFPSALEAALNETQKGLVAKYPHLQEQERAGTRLRGKGNL